MTPKSSCSLAVLGRLIPWCSLEAVHVEKARLMIRGLRYAVFPEWVLDSLGKAQSSPDLLSGEARPVGTPPFLAHGNEQIGVDERL